MSAQALGPKLSQCCGRQHEDSTGEGGESFILQRSRVCLFPISFENKIRLAWQLDKERLSPRKNLYMVSREGYLLPGV